MNIEHPSSLTFKSNPSDPFAAQKIPEKLRIDQPRGWSWIGGLPFLLAGLFCAVALYLPILTNTQRFSWQTVGWSLFCSIFAGFGAVMVFGRSGAWLDRKAWSVTRWWGLPFKIWSRTSPLEKISQVRLDRILNDDFESFCVRLVREGQQAGEQVFDSQCYFRTRVQAERIATFLGWVMHDHSRDETVVREPAALQESLREQLWRSGGASEVPVRPKESQVECRVEGGSLSLQMPASGIEGAHRAVIVTGQVFLAAVLFGLGKGVMGASVARSGSVGDYYMVMAIVLTFSFVGLWTAFRVIRAGRKWAARATSVYLDDQALRMIHHSNFEDECVEMSIEELEELVIGEVQEGISWKRTEGLIARSDHKIIEFGAGLSREELDWLRDSVYYTLRMQPKR